MLLRMPLLFLLFVMFINSNQVFAECDRSRYILGAEDVCWSRKVELVERVEYAQKKIVNFAKKTFGMDTVTKDEPQKCDYYYCIFSEMNLNEYLMFSGAPVYYSSRNGNKINPEYDVPCIERTTKWVKSNVLYYKAVPLIDRIQACSKELGNSLGSQQQFLADNVGKSDRTVSEANQTKCEIASEYMKCLAFGQDSECPIFQYP